jgi:hypothetical protein
MRIALSLAALAGAAASQSALFLNERNTTFVYSVYPNATGATTGTTSFVAASTNHLALSWWYYRVSGDASGAAFNTAGGQMTASATPDRRIGTLDWTNVDGRGFAARLVNQVYSTGSQTGTTTQAMTITNNGGSPLTITVYAYADIDIDGFSTDDSAHQMTGEPAGQTRVTDPSAATVYFKADGHAGWEAALWPTLRDNILTTAYSLANAGLPLLNQDYSGAFSWTATINPSASQTFRCLLSIGREPTSRNVGAATTYGTAKAGAPGLPDWTLNRPFSGTSVNLQITNGLTGAAPIVFIGTTTTSLPLPPFGTVYVVPAATFGMPAFNATGVSVLALPVPPLNAGVVHFQGLWGDAAAAGGVAHTAGLTWTIGSY